MKTSPITWVIIRILTRRGKRHVKELRSNCARAGEELKVNIVDYCVYPNRDISPSHYEFLIEPERQQDPGAFMIITSSTEIIGKGFRGFN